MRTRVDFSVLILALASALFAGAVQAQENAPVPPQVCRLLTTHAEAEYREAWSGAWTVLRPHVELALDLSRSLTDEERALARSIGTPISNEVPPVLARIFDEKIRNANQKHLGSNAWAELIVLGGLGKLPRQYGVWSGRLHGDGDTHYVEPEFIVSLADLTRVETITARAHQSLACRVADRFGQRCDGFPTSPAEFARRFGGAPPECFEPRVEPAGDRARIKSPEAPVEQGPMAAQACHLLVATAEVQYREVNKSVWDRELRPFVQDILDLSRSLTDVERAFAGEVQSHGPIRDPGRGLEILRKRVESLNNRLQASSRVSIHLALDASGRFDGYEVASGRFKVALSDLASIEAITAAAHRSLLRLVSVELGMDPDAVHASADLVRRLSGAPSECFATRGESVSGRSQAKRETTVASGSTRAMARAGGAK